MTVKTERSAVRLRTIGVPTTITPLTAEVLAEIANDVLGVPISIAGTAVLELSARHPYDAAGLMDFYMPGRWDSTYNLVFMDTIVQGASVGEWEGTAGYGQFTAPAAGDYLIALHFSGYQTTMRLDGPWGVNTAHCNTTSDEAVVLAQWTATSGESLYFEFSCVADSGSYGIGYLESIQFHQI